MIKSIEVHPTFGENRDAIEKQIGHKLIVHFKQPIVDLPLISQIQAFFLSSFFKKDNVVLANEKNNLNSKIILKTDLEYLNDTENNYNIVLNQN